MKRKLVILILLSIMHIYASEIDDIRFAIGLYSDKNYDFAESQIESFLNKYPQSKYLNEAKFMLANIQFSEKNYEKAIQQYEYLDKNYNNVNTKADIMLNLAQSYFYVDSQNSKTENLLDKFIKTYPKNSKIGKAYYIKSKILFLKSEYANSQKYIKLAKPKYHQPNLISLEIDVLLAQNKFDEAVNLLPELKEFSSNYNISLIKIQQQFLANDLHDKLIKTYENNQIIEDQNLADLHNQLVAIAFYEKGNFTQSQNFLNQIVSPTNTAKYYHGLIEMKLQNYTQADSIFVSLSNVENIDISTNAKFYLAKISGINNINEAITQLEEFIKTNPKHKFIDEANYQLGLNYFKISDYQLAQKYLETAVKGKFDKSTKDKANFLLAECYFQLDYLTLAEEKLNKLIKSNSEFSDEAYFKIGLIYFLDANYPIAFSNFDSLIKKYPNSDKKGITNYYLGEIYFFKNQYLLAKEKYEQALVSDKEKSNMIKQRFAEIFYFQNKFKEANNQLKDVKNTDENKFSLRLLQGNIYFAQKQFSQSLKQYLNAQTNADLDEEKVIIKTKLAQNYYQLKKYDLAAQTFAELSKDADNEKFLLMTANSFFKNNKYEKAIKEYQNILKKFPDTSYKNEIEISIADSYYNNAQYENAKNNYSELVVTNQQKFNNETIINGFFWSASQIDSLNLENEVTQLLDNLTNEKTKNHVKFRFAKSYLEKGEYEKSIKVLNSINKNYKSNEILSLKIDIYMNLEDYKIAQNLCEQYKTTNLNADLYSKWAEILYIQNDLENATKKMENAISLSNDEQLSLRLLELYKEQNSAKFSTSYQNFIKNAQPINISKAEILAIEFQINNKQYADLDAKIERLLQSDYEIIRAKAQFLKGKKMYDKGEFKAAIIEFLRIRYLYPKYNELKLKAEYLAALGYLKIDQIDDAQKVYSTLEEQLTDAQKEVYQTELAKKVEKK